MSRHRFFSTVKAEGFPVEAACEVAEVSTSAHYDWLARSAAPSDAEWDEALLVDEMRRVHDELDDTYGSPRMTDELRDRSSATTTSASNGCCPSTDSTPKTAGAARSAPRSPT